MPPPIGVRLMVWGISGRFQGDWRYVTRLGVPIEGAANREKVSDARQRTSYDTLYSPNADGSFPPITLMIPDLHADRDDVDVGVQFTLTPILQGNDLIEKNLISSIQATANFASGNSATDPRAIGHVIFSDDDAVPYKVTAKSTSSYRLVGGSNSVTIKVVDQYGDAMRGQHVVAVSGFDGTGDLTSESSRDGVISGSETEDRVVYPEEMDITVQATEDRVRTTDTASPGEAGDDVFYVNTGVPILLTGSGEPATKVKGPAPANPNLTAANALGDGQNAGRSPLSTRSNGERRIGYRHIGDDAETETITSYVLVAGDNPATGDRTNMSTDDDMVEASYHLAAGPAKVHWAEIGNKITSPVTNQPLAGGTDVDVLLADSGGRVIVVNQGSTEDPKPNVYYYDEDDTFIVEGVGATFAMFEEALKAAPATVSWRNYNVALPNARPGRIDRTIWELTLNCGGSSGDG